MPSNKAEWQTLAEDRKLDAEALLAAQRWSAAYYLSGYVVECGLKACIVNYVTRSPGIIFINKKYSEDCWVHSPKDLLALADLKATLDGAMAANSALRTNWGVVSSWREISRYDQQKDQASAEKLFNAVANQPDGVLRWIKGHW